MDADREHLDLAQRRDKALLKALRAECSHRAALRGLIFSKF